jgi:O-Antigen ligase
MSVLPLIDRRRLPPPATDILWFLSAALLGLLVGYGLLRNPPVLRLLLLLPGLVFVLSVPLERLFAGWLFCAPLVQGVSSGAHHANALYKYVYLLPPAILLVRMAAGGLRRRHFWAVDAVPALYLLYVIVQARLNASEFTGSDSSLRAIYSGVGIAIVGYYFAAFGTTSPRFPVAAAKSLLWAGIIVASLALVDAATAWNIWNIDEVGAGTTVRRVVSTFTSPGALGAFLGSTLVLAVAILAWNSPRTLRAPAILSIVLSVPAMFFTYSRGPVLGAAAVIVLMVLVANRARWPSVLVMATVATLLFAVWGHISSSAVYHERLGVTETVNTRDEIQRVSLDLFRQKPIFGWGYNTFDKAKLTVSSRDPRFDMLSSHNTFLTVLVELGVFGLALLLIPWIVIGWRAISAAWRGEAEPWIIGACIGMVAAYVLGALTYDARFFSLVTALPWIALGIARNVSATQRAGMESPSRH